MSGRVEIDYLNEEYDLDLPESDDYSTVAGYPVPREALQLATKPWL